MDSNKMTAIEKINPQSFLLTSDFRDELQRGATSELRDFKNRVSFWTISLTSSCRCIWFRQRYARAVFLWSRDFIRGR